MIRVLVAEDSPTVRTLIVAVLAADPDIQVIGEAATGAEAVELAARLHPDLITMDINMPVMDGLEATKEIMVATPTPIIIVSASDSRRDVELSLSAIRVGALMALPKPDSPSAPDFADRARQLVAMVKAMAGVRVVRRWRPKGWNTPRDMPRVTPTSREIRLVAIAASTGGPAAIQRILADLPREFPVPIVVVQHIAHGFVSGLADWLNGSCDLRVKVGQRGEALLGHTVYLAPDGQHLGVDGRMHVTLGDDPPVNGFRPSASYLFASAARACGGGMVAVILTGMGSDGVEGLQVVRASGGHVIAQDEASSVVFGMPGEAVKAGLVNTVLPVHDIGPRLADLIVGTGVRNGGAHPTS